jgi:hypothetical protein
MLICMLNWGGGNKKIIRTGLSDHSARALRTGPTRAGEI